MNDLDLKINAHFGGLVVRKDLVKEVKGNAIVPTFVLEYLLGQYCASDDEETIRSGIDTVKEILARHYVHRNEANLTRATIKEKGHHKVIDKIAVTLNDKKDVYEAQFANLGLKEVLVDSDTIKAHPKLLVMVCGVLPSWSTNRRKTRRYRLGSWNRLSLSNSPVSIWIYISNNASSSLPTSGSTS
jgi:ATP-dependent Lon protease